jgi:hypothetical protein
MVVVAAMLICAFVLELCRQMANNGLSGALSPSIGNLSYLQTM